MKFQEENENKICAAKGFENENNAANRILTRLRAPLGENENIFDIIKIGNIPSLTSEMKNWKIKIFLDGATKKCQTQIPFGHTIFAILSRHSHYFETS